MSEHRLECCVVRDLLPSYIEGLTEEETSAMVQEHLAQCSGCHQLEEDMRRVIPVEKAPERTLNFLKRVKRTRLMASVLVVLVTLGSMWWLYDREFHYPNTEAGQLAAVEEYVPSPKNIGWTSGVEEGTRLRVLGHAERGEQVYIAYAADNADHVHGVLTMTRGFNGKYRPIGTTEEPFAYTAGVMGGSIWPRMKGEKAIPFLMGDGCREIYSIDVVYFAALRGSEELHPYRAVYDVSEPDFLWMQDLRDLEAQFDIPEGELERVVDWEIMFLDQDGQDITAQYEDGTVTDTWGGGKGSAELFLVYVYMGITAALGILFVRYFLRND